ncbi:hypothetical protein ACFVVL_31075 [Kitasatospora sp. NPDC058115]|uniref:hypothetical protein n=1 Tax=Kitasatospora sp. NPDC058115 TaxID=3346347 RepID=UPI0036D8F53F
MLELLPGTGVTLPDGAGTLGFGTTPQEASAMLAATPGSHRARQCAAPARADFASLRDAHDAWLAGILFDPAWNTVGVFGDLALTVAGGGPGRADGLAQVIVEAGARPGPRGEHPVVWDGVDLFGHPAADVVSVLPGSARPSSPTADDVTVPELGLRLHRSSPSATRWSRLALLATPTGWERCCPGTFACAEGGNGLAPLFGEWLSP